MSNTTVQTQGPDRRGIAIGGSITLWTLQVAIGAFFIMGGLTKLMGTPEMIGMFDAIGFGQWFRYVTGLLEMTGGVLLFVPTVAAIGAVLLAGIMVGAIITHALFIGGSAMLAIVLLAVNSAIAFVRRDQIARLAKRAVSFARAAS